MPEILLVDGPLKGQTFLWHNSRTSEPLGSHGDTIALVGYMAGPSSMQLVTAVYRFQVLSFEPPLVFAGQSGPVMETIESRLAAAIAQHPIRWWKT